MKAVARLLNDMLSTNIVKDYAVVGAVAQMLYTEAAVTMDAAVLIVTPQQRSIDMLNPIYEFCSSRGCVPEGEAIRVGDWPVQFIPTFNPLAVEAVREAETGEIDGVPLRVVQADFLATIALSTGRPKDFARILALLESGAVSSADIAKLAMRFELQSEWRKFKERFLDE